MTTETHVQYSVLTREEKKKLVKELWDYHDTIVQNDLASCYSEKFNIGFRTFKEQLAGRRGMKPSQTNFVIDFLLSQDRTSERGIREVFRSLFQAEPETFGYLLAAPEPLPFDEPTEPSSFERWKKGQLKKQPIET